MSPSSEADRSFEDIVFEYAEAVSGQTGEAFFRSLAEYLARTLHADYVFLGALQADGERIATLAVHGGDGERAPFEYSLAETPCAVAVQKQVRSHQSGVR